MKREGFFCFVLLFFFLSAFSDTIFFEKPRRSLDPNKHILTFRLTIALYFWVIYKHHLNIGKSQHSLFYSHSQLSIK